jgi:hypothetical protein
MMADQSCAGHGGGHKPDKQFHYPAATFFLP